MQVKFRVGGTPEIWDAIHGNRSAADVRSRTADSTAVVLNFEPYQSHIVVFSKENAGLPKAADHLDTVSAVDLSLDWSVSFGKTPAVEMNHLHSWADDDATRYFSGTATYERSFDLAGSFNDAGSSSVLDFGEGSALENTGSRNGMQTWYDPPIREAANVYVNGQKAGSLWCPPYKIDITKLLKPGRNNIRVDVANTALNYMSGRKLPDYKLLTLRYGERFQAQDMDKVQPIASGLLGPVKLVLLRRHL